MPIAAINILLFKGILVFFCLFTLLFGALFTFFPQTISKMNRWGQRVLFPQTDTVPRSPLLGAVLILLGLIMAGILIAL